MKTYLITGGAGFIGSHLTDVLLAAGHHVLVLDDLSTGRERNLAHVAKHPHLECHIASVCDRDALEPLVERADGVFHLAAAVGVRLVVESPVRTMHTNIHGTEAVLDAARRRHIPVIVASSSEVYGKSTKVPFHENDDLVLGNSKTGRWSYACSKALDEFLALAYWREHGLPVIVVRLFNTVGRRQTGQYGMVLPTFVRQALAGGALTVFGDGSQRRCFCAVEDVVAALVTLIDRREAIGQVFNIGTDHEITITELAERVQRRAASASEIRYVPYAEAWDEQFEDMQRRIPDLTRIRTLIGFVPTIDLDETIGHVIEHERGEPA